MSTLSHPSASDSGSTSRSSTTTASGSRTIQSQSIQAIQPAPPNPNVVFIAPIAPRPINAAQQSSHVTFAGGATHSMGIGIGSASTTTSAQPSRAGSVDSAAADERGRKRQKRRKVNHACLYCRRSHMTCDDGRPCQRCIKREIGHLCHDEPRGGSSKPGDKSTGSASGNTAVASSSQNTLDVFSASSTKLVRVAPAPAPTPAWPASAVTPNALLYPPETLRNEFSVLTDFLETLDERSFFQAPAASTVPPHIMAGPSFGRSNSTSGSSIAVNPSNLSSASAFSTLGTSNGAFSTDGTGMGTETVASPPFSSSLSGTGSGTGSIGDSVFHGHTGFTPKIEEIDMSDMASLALLQGVDLELDLTRSSTPITPVEELLPTATKAERFLLTAADQAAGSRDERLNRVIRSKYEAGLLRPYNYVTGYARLSKWMDTHVSQVSKRAILEPLSVLRPKFRAIAQSLTDMDHVYIEEAFERLLLDYDRVFSAMGIPACLWRRTGEIYKGNRELAELLGVDIHMLRDGRLCIYELMAEESAVNYWEKYAHVAFDSSQKAVLTSCVLRYKPSIPPPQPMPDTPDGFDGGEDGFDMGMGTGVGMGGAMANAVVATAPASAPDTQEGFINCCFSITIRRDSWGIPSMIVGNFIKIG